MSSSSLIAGLRSDGAERQHQEARCAEATLQSMIGRERLLERMQLTVFRKPLDSGDAATLCLDRKHQAGANRLVVDQHGAGAAYSMLAAEMRPGRDRNRPAAHRPMSAVARR